MLEHRTSSHRQCSFAVNGCKYHGNVSYRCNGANVSLAKYVTSHLIVAGNKKTGLDSTGHIGCVS
jgi:hypothetical protein